MIPIRATRRGLQISLSGFTLDDANPRVDYWPHRDQCHILRITYSGARLFLNPWLMTFIDPTQSILNGESQRLLDLSEGLPRP